MHYNYTYIYRREELERAFYPRPIYILPYGNNDNIRSWLQNMGLDPTLYVWEPV